MKEILNGKSLIIVFCIFALVSIIACIIEGDIRDAQVFSLFFLACCQAIEIKNLQESYSNILGILSMQIEINEKLMDKVKK